MISKALVAVATGLATVGGGAALTVSSAQDQPITRTELLRTDVAGIAGKEVVIYVADVKPGGAGGKHTHYGDEFVYVLEGVLVVEPVGKPAIALKPGETGHFTPDIVHAAKNASDSAGAKVLVVLLVEQGKPLA